MDLRKLFLTKNKCYIVNRSIKPVGVMWHSTGANNPNLKRYVGPDDGALGLNTAGNHWNTARPGGRQICAHAFIGKLANGKIATYQTLPWDIEGWHSASGPKGSANKLGYIGFEICEDGLQDAAYFGLVYQEAVELTAMLCQMYGLDPLKDGVVICHSEGHKRGIASNHADVMHWFPKHGKSMDTARADVAKLLKTQVVVPPAAEDPRLTKIARVVAAESRGEPYEGQLAVAQCIYNRLNDPGKRFGKTLDEVLRPGQFASPWPGTLSTVKCLQATKDVFEGGKRVFQQPVLYFLSKGASAATFEQRHKTYAYLGKIGGHDFWGDTKLASAVPYAVKVPVANLQVRSGPGATYATAQVTGVGTFTIIEEKGGWGKLKSGAGWIKLDFSDLKSTSIEIGDVVQFKGGKHYVSSNALNGIVVKAGPAKVTQKAVGAKHPYHIVHTTNASKVYGWVDSADISK